MRISRHRMSSVNGLIFLGALVVSGAAFNTLQLSGSGAASGRSGWNEIDQNRLLANIKIVASDEFEGRAPASKGEELTMAFWRRSSSGSG